MKLLLFFCICALSAAALAAPNRLARLERARERVPGRYIVKVKVGRPNVNHTSMVDSRNYMYVLSRMQSFKGTSVFS